MKARKLISLYAERATGAVPGASRRKASDFAALLVGVAMLGAMHGSPVAGDEAIMTAGVASPAEAVVEVVEEAEAPVIVAVVQAEVAQTAPPAADEKKEEKAAEVPQPVEKPVVAASPAQPQPAPEAARQQPRAETSSRSDRYSIPTGTGVAERFIAVHWEEAQQSMQETGVPASVTLAQAILESNSGQSGLAKNGQNYFGIKAQGKEGPAGVIYMDTGEHLDGRNVTVRAPFRKYHNAAESFADHGRYLRENSRYAEAMKNTGDAEAFARLIHKAGYATDPDYAAKLIRLMDRYSLYQFDR